MQTWQTKLQHTAVIGAAVIGAVLAVGVLSAQSAIAQSSVVANYNPLTQRSATYVVDDLTSDTETIDVTITGFSFIPSVLGTFDITEEPPPFGDISDRIIFSNTGPGGTGFIDITSGNLTSISGATICADEVDQVLATCSFILPLANSRITLLATFTSLGGDIQGSLISDTLTIVTAPEPTSLAAIGSALAAMGLLGWRRRKEV